MGRARRDQTGAAGELPDLALEVLDLVEVRRPVQRPVGIAAAAAQVDGVAQSLAEAGEVPDAAVVAGVVVAGGARDVFLEGDAVVLGVVEVLLA